MFFFVSVYVQLISWSTIRGFRLQIYYCTLEETERDYFLEIYLIYICILYFKETLQLVVVVVVVVVVVWSQL